MTHKRAKISAVPTVTRGFQNRAPLSSHFPGILMPDAEPRSRAWCFTIFQSGRDPIPIFEGSSYSIAGWEECPTTKRMHWQCYAYFPTLKSASQMREMHPGVHNAPAKASAKKNKGYCGKSGDFVTTGTPPEQGKRTDLDNVTEMLRNGASAATIAALYPAHVLRLSHRFQHYRDIVRPARTDRPVSVHVYYGETGTGKTRRVLHTEPSIYWVPFWDGKKVWFDNYHGEKAICLDDFDGSMDFRLLLHLTDRYTRQWQVKGSFVTARWDRVYITSDRHPRAWYSESGANAKNWPQLKRRLSQIWSFTEDLVQLESGGAGAAAPV